MKKSLIVFCIVFGLIQPCFAKTDFHIEVLQVSKIAPFDDAYKGFVDELAKNDIVEGKNLIIKRHIIDADADAGIWQKVVIYVKIKNLASQIVNSKPDLVLTISTPATKYSKDKIIKAGIPLVFTCVANPPLIGCPSVTIPSKGLTGATLYQDPLTYLVLAQMAKPNIKTMGLIHSDDENAIAFAEETKIKAPQLGIKVLTKEVGKSDSIKPPALELIKAGIDSFIIPLDTYYALRNLEPSHDLSVIANEHNIPGFVFANFNEKGAVLYVGPDFTYVGALSGKQVVKILKDGVKPEELPILKQEELNIYVDIEIAKKYGLEITPKLLEKAKPR